MKYRVSLDIFEGPIELLLYLVKRDRLDISDIPIARITEEYLHYLKALRTIKIDHIGDFLLIASILLRFKLSSLLPIEKELGPTSVSLARILTEFSGYKRAASFLSEQEEKSRLIFSRRGEVYYESIDKEDISSLLSVIGELLKKRRWGEPLRITGYGVSVEEMMERLKQDLKIKGKLDFKRLILDSSEMMEALTIFLAVLELARLGEISIQQSKPFHSITIRMKNYE